MVGRAHLAGIAMMKLPAGLDEFVDALLILFAAKMGI